VTQSAPIALHRSRFGHVVARHWLTAFPAGKPSSKPSSTKYYLVLLSSLRSTIVMVRLTATEEEARN
jgi:hypothetical protein